MSFAVFGNHSKLLPAFSHPYKDEVLSSWLTRLAFDNGLSRSMLLRLAGLAGKGKTDLNVDYLPSISTLDILTEYTNCSSIIIRNASLHYYNNKLFSTHINNIISHIWQAKPPLSICNSGNANLLYCPNCLKDDEQPVYYRRKWRLSVSFACVKCQCYLRETCPHCSRPSSEMRNAGAMCDYVSSDEYLLTCGGCNKNISECYAEPAPPHVIEMQQQINNYLDQSYSATERYSVGYFRVLYGLARMLLKSSRNQRYGTLCNEIYRLTQTPDYRLDNRRADFLDLSIKQRADVYCMAIWLLEEWPGRLKNLCLKHRLSEKSMLSVIYDPPEWYCRVVGDLIGTSCKEDLARERYRSSMADEHELKQRIARWQYDFDDQEHYYSSNHCYIDVDNDDEGDRTKDLFETLYAGRYPELFDKVA